MDLREPNLGDHPNSHRNSQTCFRQLASTIDDTDLDQSEHHNISARETGTDVLTPEDSLPDGQCSQRQTHPYYLRSHDKKKTYSNQKLGMSLDGGKGDVKETYVSSFINNKHDEIYVI